MWVADRNEVVFTDESRICLQHHDGRIRVWRHREERMLNSCVMHRHTCIAPGIMVCGGIGYHTRTPLERIAATLNREARECLLRHHPTFSVSVGSGFLIDVMSRDVTEFDCPRIITSTIARLRTEHLKGTKIHPDKTRSYVQCQHCPDLQLTPNHISSPNHRNKVTKNGNGPSGGFLRKLLFSPDAPRIAEAVIKTFDGI
ncbi:transposable element Tc3 transposase [Trichonephila clavipes]|uniref:Transposable element Tc3 transposase n=1 Tax=Trichonephila clavipes TaxID=2585209 RepID=A0A8X6STR3_TRICX|nr:transposable element Tc3 transposase [Trichonephila clavipes]